MIFRIDGEVGELLALTPIIVEWRKRNHGEKVFVETKTPEVFANNPNVEFAGARVQNIDDFYDMNLVKWHNRGMSVAEVYAEMVFGDKNLASWKQFMARDPSKMVQAKKGTDWIPEEKKIVAVAFGEKMIDSGVADEVMNEVYQLGYVILDVSHMNDVGLVLATICMADLFIGEDGDEAAIALTTDKPAIVCYSYRVPDYFPPFRGDIPFVPLTPDRSVCENARVCYSENSHTEYAKFYSQGCTHQQPFHCRNRSLKQDVVNAIRRISDKA